MSMFDSQGQLRAVGGIASGSRKGIDDLEAEIYRLRDLVCELERKAAIVDWIAANAGAIDFGHEYLFRVTDTKYPSECTNANLIVCVRSIMRQKGLL